MFSNLLDFELRRKRKVNQTVRIPDTLDLSAYVSTGLGGGGGGEDNTEEGMAADALSCRYRLSSILYHKGNSADMGHYVAEVQNHASRKWFVMQPVLYYLCSIQDRLNTT